LKPYTFNPTGAGRPKAEKNLHLTPSTVSYYQSIESFIKRLSSSYTVIGNPGDPFLTGVTPTECLSTADIFNISEGPNTARRQTPAITTIPTA